MNSKLVIFTATGILVALIIVNIFQFPYDAPNGIDGYDELTNDLITREFSMDFVIYDERPQSLCFILEEQKGTFYQNLESSLQSADISYWSAPAKNEREFVHMDVYINPTKIQGLELIKEHDFKHSKKKSETYNIKNLDDYYHEFLCNFEYDKKYYQMQLYFSNLYPTDDNFTFVNFTRIDGNPTIQNQDIEIFHNGFNSTVIFYNQLENSVTLSFDQKQRDGKTTIFHEYDIIPPNKQWPHSFSYFNEDGPQEFRYVVNPYNLSGTVTFKSHPNCMDTDFAASLYSQTDLEIKLPTYLPNGYVHKCSVESGYRSLVSTYSKNDLDPNFSSWNEEKFYQQRGLAIMNANRMSSDVEWEMRENDRKTNCDYIENGTNLEINHNGQYSSTIFVKNDYDLIGVNTIMLCDGNYSFSIRGQFSQEELVKIAESMQ